MIIVQLSDLHVRPAGVSAYGRVPTNEMLDEAIEDQVQAVISGKKQADEAVRDAQKNADEILRPYNEKIAHVSAF